MYNQSKQIKKAIGIGGIFLLLTFFYYHIDKYLSWWVLIIAMLIIAIAFVLIIVNIIKGMIFMIKNKRIFHMSNVLPTLTYLLALLLSFSSSEVFMSKTKFTACYEGTQNQANIKFRSDNSFELHWTGVFFYNSWNTGHWQQKRDTLFLTYDKYPAKVLGPMLLIDNGYLRAIDKSVDEKERQNPRFYLGLCKGLN